MWNGLQFSEFEIAMARMGDRGSHPQNVPRNLPRIIRIF
jgi:hypothetical protein